MAVKKRVRYAKIDVALYDNPRLMSYKGLAGEAGRPEGEGSGEESGEHKEHHKEPRVKKRLMPHEELLLFVGQEWKDLVVEVSHGSQYGYGTWPAIWVWDLTLNMGMELGRNTWPAIWV